MKKYLKIFAVITAMVLCFTACGKKALDETQAKALAEKHTQYMLNGEFKAVTADFDENVAKNIDETALKQGWDSVVSLAGEYMAPYGVNTSQNSGLTVVHTTLEYKNMGVVLSISYNSDGTIAGIWVSTETIESDLTETEQFGESFITIGEHSLKGVVTLPKNAENYPVAVLVQGSGASDYNETIGANKPFKEIAHYLAQNGIASVRINKRYFQKPELPQENITIYGEYMDDIYAAIDYSKQNISRDVFVVGHSLGAMSAPKIARDNNATGVVMLAGTINGLEDVVYEQNMATLETMDEYSKKEKDKIRQAIMDGVAAVKALKPGDTDPVLGIPASYWLSLKDLKAEEYLNNTQLPVLVMQGTADFQVSYEDDYQKMERLFGGKDNFVFKEYDGLNHIFMPQSKPGVIDVSEYREENHIPEYVLKDIAEFINNNK